MHRPLLAVLAMSLLFISADPVPADTLSIPETQMSIPETQMDEPETQASESEPLVGEPETQKETFSITLPGRGMTMEQVKARFGLPREKNAAVGTPPISTWVYQSFTVYFENRYVIHAVFHKPK